MKNWQKELENHCAMKANLTVLAVHDYLFKDRSVLIKAVCYGGFKKLLLISLLSKGHFECKVMERINHEAVTTFIKVIPDFKEVYDWLDTFKYELIDLF